jgi:hypothetical protein
MSFNPMPSDWRQRKYDQLEHAQNMLNLIGALGAYSVQPLPKYDFGQQAGAISQQMNSDFLNNVLSANADRVAPRRAAMHRRLSR